MNKTLINLIVFAAGAVAGSAATWMYVNRKYDLLSRENEELDEYYSYCEEYATSDEEEDDDHCETVNGYHDKPNLMEYSKVVQENGYVDYSGRNNAPVEPSTKVDDTERPYVISPEEFGEVGYSTVSLTYYRDEILTDEDGDIIADVDDIVGRDSLNTFGEYEDDSVFVRDDRRKVDYEILADPRNYSDVIKSNPHLAEDE